jgi:hypothetical protein
MNHPNNCASGTVKCFLMKINARVLEIPRELLEDSPAGAYGRGEKFTHRFSWKTGRDETLAKPRRRWVDNIKMNLRQIECEDVNRIHLAQDRVHWRVLVNTVLRLQGIS